MNVALLDLELIFGKNFNDVDLNDADFLLRTYLWGANRQTDSDSCSLNGSVQFGSIEFIIELLHDLMNRNQTMEINLNRFHNKSTLTCLITVTIIH